MQYIAGYNLKEQKQTGSSYEREVMPNFKILCNYIKNLNTEFFLVFNNTNKKYFHLPFLSGFQAINLLILFEYKFE